MFDCFFQSSGGPHGRLEQHGIEGACTRRVAQEEGHRQLEAVTRRICSPRPTPAGPQDKIR